MASSGEKIRDGLAQAKEGIGKLFEGMSQAVGDAGVKQSEAEREGASKQVDSVARGYGDNVLKQADIDRESMEALGNAAGKSGQAIGDAGTKQANMEKEGATKVNDNVISSVQAVGDTAMQHGLGNAINAAKSKASELGRLAGDHELQQATTDRESIKAFGKAMDKAGHVIGNAGVKQEEMESKGVLKQGKDTREKVNEITKDYKENKEKRMSEKETKNQNAHKKTPVKQQGKTNGIKRQDLSSVLGKANIQAKGKGGLAIASNKDKNISIGKGMNR